MSESIALLADEPLIPKSLATWTFYWIIYRPCAFTLYHEPPSKCELLSILISCSKLHPDIVSQTPTPRRFLLPKRGTQSSQTPTALPRFQSTPRFASSSVPRPTQARTGIDIEDVEEVEDRTQGSHPDSEDDHLAASGTQHDRWTLQIWFGFRRLSLIFVCNECGGPRTFVRGLFSLLIASIAEALLHPRKQLATMTM